MKYITYGQGQDKHIIEQLNNTQNQVNHKHSLA